MPVYEYECRACGPFTDMRPMSECADPQACPVCAWVSPRVILTAPHYACMPAGTRKARAINEQSANAPKTLDQYKAAHRSGCQCCSPKPSRFVAKTKSGAKSFPAARPWMISH